MVFEQFEPIRISAGLPTTHLRFGLELVSAQAVPAFIGTEMSNSLHTEIQLRQVREIASRKLRQYGKHDSVVRECYLFEKDFFVGVRYDAGPICFLWQAAESSAQVLRDDLLIEKVELVPSREERRAA